jgi:pimeloyl-ACP methyl ester carboxylesterase
VTQSELIKIVDCRRESDNMILFLPGISGSNGQWASVIDSLTDVDADFAYGSAVIANPAFGAGVPVISTVVRALAGELESSRYKSVVIVAHSVGAFVALGIARTLPKLVSGVVLTNGGLASAGRFLDGPLHELIARPRSCLMLVRLFVLVSLPTPESLRKRIAKNRRLSRALLGSFVSDSAIDDVESRTALVESSNRPDVLVGIWKNRHHWREFVSYADGIETSVVFAVGDRDPMSTVCDTEDMAGMLPDSRVVVLPGVGHAAPLEAREVIADLIRQASVGHTEVR